MSVTNLFDPETRQRMEELYGKPAKDEPMEWQPIETAPLNQPVLVWSGHVVMIWRKEIFGPRVGSRWKAWGRFTKAVPLCWMPLPYPPKA